MDITAQEWKVDNGKIEVIPFVVKPSSKLSIVNVEISIQVWGGGCSLRSFLYFRFTWIDDFQILCKFCVFRNNTSSIYLKVKLNCCARCFLPALRRLCTNSASYEYKKQVGKQRCTVRTHRYTDCLLKYPNSTKILSIRLQHFYDICSWVFCGASEWSRTKYVSY